MGFYKNGKWQPDANEIAAGEYQEVHTPRQIGLKDHQICQLVNAIRDAVQPLTPVQSLRERISSATIKYLEDNNLRIDAR